MAQHRDDTLLEAQRSKLKPPPMYKVMLLNDDYTPMEFVVLVLQKFFGMTRERANTGIVRFRGIGKARSSAAWRRTRTTPYSRRSAAS